MPLSVEHVSSSPTLVLETTKERKKEKGIGTFSSYIMTLLWGSKDQAVIQ